MAAAAVTVEEDPTRHWIGKGGGRLPPSRWADSEQKKITIDNDSDPNGGRCLGIRCLDYVLKYHQIPRWEACDYKKKM